jgi:hypothetical protein
MPYIPPCILCICIIIRGFIMGGGGKVAGLDPAM